jgi:hypothetical protein
LRRTDVKSTSASSVCGSARSASCAAVAVTVSGRRERGSQAQGQAGNVHADAAPRTDCRRGPLTKRKSAWLTIRWERSGRASAFSGFLHFAVSCGSGADREHDEISRIRAERADRRLLIAIAFLSGALERARANESVGE